MAWTEHIFRFPFGDDEYIIRLGVDDDRDEAYWQNINEFWTNSDLRRKDHGSHKMAILYMLAYAMMMTELSNATWQLDVNLHNSGARVIEGWPKLDGSEGLRILDVEAPYVADSAFYHESRPLQTG